MPISLPTSTFVERKLLVRAADSLTTHNHNPDLNMTMPVLQLVKLGLHGAQPWICLPTSIMAFTPKMQNATATTIQDQKQEVATQFSDSSTDGASQASNLDQADVQHQATQTDINLRHPMLPGHLLRMVPL